MATLKTPRWGLVVIAIAASACSDVSTTLTPTGSESLSSLCSQLQNEVLSGSPKDGIPALSDPVLVSAGDVRAEYLLPDDRVIGVEIDGEYLAFPHNVLWWHEIVNLNDVGLAVTYCPLTGSGMVFDRGVVGGAELGVSGLLFKNNLVMYDRAPSGVVESLWPQMTTEAHCGPAEGRSLEMVPSVEMEWEAWVTLHPQTRVVSDETGFSRDYTLNPYGDYEREDNELTLAPLEEPVDERRPTKERVLGIPFPDGGGLAFPFGELRTAGDHVVIHTILGDGLEGGGGGVEPIVVFWESAAAAAMAFLPAAAGLDLTFAVSDGAFVDLETGSRWSVDGEALSGPLAGARLIAIPEAYVSFWFAFAEFFPKPVLWLS